MNAIYVMTFIYRNQIQNLIFLVVCGILAVATALSNVTVLIILLTNKKLMNGQAVYRISLAMSDVFAGIIVFPTCIYTNFNFVLKIFENGFIYINTYASQTYIDVIGFFTMLNLHVSIYTLIAAAIDRFKAVYRPLTYNTKSTIAIAWKTCVVLWTISILLAIAPIGFSKKIRYRISNKAFIIPLLFDSFYNFHIYAIVVLLTPVLIMWILTILTFVVYRKYSNQRRRLFRTVKKKQEINKQIRLSFTLGIMVAVFTICLLPTAFNSISKFFGSYLAGKVAAQVSLYVFVILTSNSLWNFFIYSARDKAFRTSMKKLKQKLYCCLKRSCSLKTALQARYD